VSVTARKIATELEALPGKTSPRSDRIAAIYAALGDLDAAFAWLDHAVAMRTGMLTFHPGDARVRFDPRRPTLRGTAPPPRMETMSRLDAAVADSLRGYW
jgi:hypothetical protein